MLLRFACERVVALCIEGVPYTTEKAVPAVAYSADFAMHELFACTTLPPYAWMILGDQGRRPVWGCLGSVFCRIDLQTPKKWSSSGLPGPGEMTMRSGFQLGCFLQCYLVVSVN
jgi:hypothetical protein